MTWEPFQPKKILGITFTLLGWLLVGLQSALIKLTHRDIPVFEIIFFEFLVMCIIAFFVIIPRGLHFFIPKKKILMFWRTLAASLGFFAYIFAGIYGSLVNASLLVNTEGLFVPIILFLGFRKKISLIIWLGLVIGFLGVVLIYPPNKGLLNWVTLLGLSAGLATAIVILMTSVLIKTDPSVKQVFYYGLLASLLAAIFNLNHWIWPLKGDWGYIIGASLCLTSALFFLIQALCYAEPYIIAGWSYSLVIFSGLAEWFFWQKLPALNSIIGFILVMVGGLIILHYHRHIGKQIKRRSQQ